jgi:hypothetical protein
MSGDHIEALVAELRAAIAEGPQAVTPDMLTRAANELDRLRTLVPTGDYVLADDMEEMRSPKYGNGLFCTFDNIKSVT